ncbi:hypothetical protein [uncultured Microbacterium sp.]|uniref:hypothetical protein n=1 Tax=uncultured Microbacterium sp. TaxID=191216 RepID=UPI0025E749A3|nr:hypothetical protein [uncultured Microbacterium sp.]
MTIVLDNLTASITGQALSVSGGRLVLDVSRAPHVTGSLIIEKPSASIMTALDPRSTTPPRVLITSGSRTFNLHVRVRPTRHVDAVVTLELSSDEGLLSDYAPLALDDATVQLASSLRAVINYVLGKAIPGAMLSASPSVDANVTPYWQVTNLAKNPGPRSSALGYGVGTGTSSITYSANIYERPCIGFFAAGTGTAFLNCPATGVRITPGRKYTAVGEVISGTTGRAVRMMMRFKDQAGNILRDVYGATATSKTNGWPTVTATLDERPYVTAEAPVNATAVEVYVNVPVNSANQFHAASRIMCYEGDRRIPYHDGTTGPAGYTFAWDDPANPDTSASTRTPLVYRALDSVIWREGTDALAFLQPLLVANGLRLVCDEARTWTLRDENYSAPGVLNIRDGVNAIDPEDTISRDDWFDARVTRYRWTDRDGIQREDIDAFALTTPYSRATYLEVDAPSPGPGRSAYAVRRAQGRGRTITVTTMANWAARAEQPTAIRLEGAPIQTGKVQRLEFNLDRGEMTITDRTVDTIAHAWILQDPARWTTGPVGQGWTEAP